MGLGFGVSAKHAKPLKHVANSTQRRAHTVQAVGLPRPDILDNPTPTRRYTKRRGEDGKKTSTAAHALRIFKSNFTLSSRMSTPPTQYELARSGSA